MIVGDINIHVDDVNCTVAKEFMELFNVANLQNLVMEPTHKDGHTLDLLIDNQEG